MWFFILLRAGMSQRRRITGRLALAGMAVAAFVAAFGLHQFEQAEAVLRKQEDLCEKGFVPEPTPDADGIIWEPLRGSFRADAASELLKRACDNPTGTTPMWITLLSP